MPSLQRNSQFVLVGRAVWMMFGPAAIFTTAALMVTSRNSSWLSTPSLLYLVALIGSIFGRWLECAGGAPQDTSGKPIEMIAVARWTAGMIFFGVAAWVVINVLKHFLS